MIGVTKLKETISGCKYLHLLTLDHSSSKCFVYQYYLFSEGESHSTPSLLIVFVRILNSYH